MSLDGNRVSGERLRISAQDWNDIAAAVRRSREAGRETSELGPPVQSAFPRGVAVVRVRNQTGASLGRFSIVGIDAPAILPATDLDAFRQEVILDGIAPVAGTHEGGFAVLLLPLEAGEVGPAVVSGVVQCRLAVSGSLEDWAEIANGVTGSLANATSGSARVLWAEAAGSERWAIVRLGNTPLSGGALTVRSGGSPVGTRPALNVVSGTYVSLTATDDSGNDEVDIAAEAKHDLHVRVRKLVSFRGI